MFHSPMLYRILSTIYGQFMIATETASVIPFDNALNSASSNDPETTCFLLIHEIKFLPKEVTNFLSLFVIYHTTSIIKIVE